LQGNRLFKIMVVFFRIHAQQVILEFTLSVSDLFFSNYCLVFVPHLTQPCPGKTFPGWHHMSVYRRVCSVPVGSPASDSAESQVAVQARKE